MLQRHDPWHVMCLVTDGEVGGALISGPEFGAVFRYWSWIFPAFRQTRLGMHGMRAFDEHFDNGRFHKAYTFVRPKTRSRSPCSAATATPKPASSRTTSSARTIA